MALLARAGVPKRSIHLLSMHFMGEVALPPHWRSGLKGLYLVLCDRKTFVLL